VDIYGSRRSCSSGDRCIIRMLEEEKKKQAILNLTRRLGGTSRRDDVFRMTTLFIQSLITT